MISLIDTAKRKYTIRQVLHLPDGKNSIVCPLPMHTHHNNTPSFSVFYDDDGFESFKCHGNCGHRGDVVDLVGFMEIRGYNPNNGLHISRALAMLDESYNAQVVVPKTKRRSTLLPAMAWRKYLPMSVKVRAYAEERGITDEAITHFKMGSMKNYLAMPAFENGRVKNIKFRKAHGRGIRFFTLKGSRKTFHNLEEVAYTTDPVIVTKGYIPTVLLWQNGILAGNVTAGENATLKEYWPMLALSEKRILVGDNDDDPDVRNKMQGFTYQRAEEIHAEVKFPPPEYKDLDEWILGDPNAISVIKSWRNQ